MLLRLLGRLEFSSSRAAAKVALCAVAAAAVALVPEYELLSKPGHWALFILVLAALLWTTEAMPAFAVSLLVMGLAIVVLGEPGTAEADPQAWEVFVRPWASPLLWLFLGGLVMAEAATRTGLDRWMAAGVLGRLGRRPAPLLAGVLTVTFVLSMFMSNTATTAMMLAVMAPIINSLPREEGFTHCLLLGVPVAANLGGMGTLIGTPPNAIAAGALHATPIGFGQWMVAGNPPALLLMLASWFFLRWRYPWTVSAVDVEAIRAVSSETRAPLWQKLEVMIVFTLTICLWLTSSLHGIPSPVISFLPITVFAITGVIGADEIRRLQWDVLLLMAGGLSLGLAVSETGLAAWLVAQLPTQRWGACHCCWLSSSSP
ncbi:MAG TPA: SLC13 family permease [Candidatus Latescibacteria bacterium]|jgi:sodium-dependent dicarboxylate transporter 2/3/5|nr:transporter [Gemmatimonadaceae bacterium]HJP33554.1 SLC13 family permease [Candidatus Latescibacterota bacterium]